MITLHIFTEEVSARNVFKEILPKILPENVCFHIYSHQGKQDLEQALKTTVPAISRLPGAKILIIRDQDNEDCKTVKKQIQDSVMDSCNSKFLIRIACHELESWFLGDLNAVKLAYPRFKPEQYQNKSKFKNVDNIQHPDMVLLSIVPEFSNRKRLPKFEVSEKISRFLKISNNNSPSFNCTIKGINRLIEK